MKQLRIHRQLTWPWNNLEIIDKLFGIEIIRYAGIFHTIGINKCTLITHTKMPKAKLRYYLFSVTNKFNKLKLRNKKNHQECHRHEM